LLIALKLKKLVVTAAFAVRIIPAHLRASLINRATSCRGVEKPANRGVNAVALMLEDNLIHALILIGLGELATRLILADLEVPRDTSQVLQTDHNSGVGATIARALAAIKS